MRAALHLRALERVVQPNAMPVSFSALLPNRIRRKPGGINNIVYGFIKGTYGRVRASGGSSQGVELVRASEWVVASVGAEISFSNLTQAQCAGCMLHAW